MKKYWNHIITFMVGICMAFSIWFYKGLFHSVMIRDTMAILSDGCFVTGIILTGFGLLMVLSNVGNFDMLTYGMRILISVFKTRTNEDKLGKSFYDYHMNKKGKVKNVSFILHVGILYLVSAAVFTTAFYKLN